jgi:hypothetical protein
VKSNFGTALMLGIAYSASIGSLGTIIGTPPNLFLIGYLKDNHDISIGFGQWMIVGVPLSVVMMAIAWFLLVKVLFKPEIDRIPGGRELIREELAKLGPMSTGEKLVLAMFVLAAVSWISLPLIFEEPPISDEGIAMAVGLLLFLIPGGANRGVRLLDWDTAEKLPWGVLLLFGGGLALSAQFSESGLTEWIGKTTSGLGVLPVDSRRRDLRRHHPVPHRTDLEHSNGGDIRTRCRGSGHGPQLRPAAADGPRRPGRDLRVYAARGDTAQCGGLRFRICHRGHRWSRAVCGSTSSASSSSLRPSICSPFRYSGSLSEPRAELADLMT